MWEILIETLRQPWPWYVAGPLIGLTVPALLWIGNKTFGVSSNLQHLCAALLPEAAKPALLRYDWRSERWAMALAAGLVLGGFIGGVLLAHPQPPALSGAAVRSLGAMGIEVSAGFMPDLLTRFQDGRALVLLALGGWLVGFGTRYGSGCTAGHAITGLSTLQWRSLVATISFFAGGILSANVLLPWLLGAR